MNIGRLLTVVTVGLWCALGVARGQPALNADAYVVPSRHPDSSVIVVFIRIPNAALTYVRVTDPNDVGGNFKASMIIGAELRDSIGVIRQRERWDRVVYATTYEESIRDDRAHVGWVMFLVERGGYSVTLEMLGTKSRRPEKLVLDSLGSRPLFVQPLIRDGKEVLRPFVLNGNLGFTSSDARALLLLPGGGNDEYDYRIQQLPYGPSDIQWWDVESIEGRTRASTQRMPHLLDDGVETEALIEIRRREDTSRSFLEIPVPVSVLVPGTYELALIPRAAWLADTLRWRFTILWERMPLSLRSIDRAMRLMRHILTDEQLDSLDGSTDVQRRRNLMDWWRRNDPTATTTVNERMQTYFQRADEADKRFSTIQEPTGSLSERGRVYMLYGPPTTVRKLLPVDDEPRETWIYANTVNKEITFGIDGQGIYRIRDVFDRSLLPAE